MSCYILFYVFMLSRVVAASALLSPRYREVTWGPDCLDVIIPIDAAAINHQIKDYNLTTTTSVESLLASLLNSANTSTNIAVSGFFNISARYCEPQVNIRSREATLQFLVHGITYNKYYWSALGFPGYDPDRYSWIKYASQRGYPTLSIDRAGYGNSSHPDPYGIDQAPIQSTILHHIIQRLRAGDIVSRKFDKVVYIGHSLGSILGNNLATTYPDACDALILTGYSGTVSPAIVSLTSPVPAITFASRFADLSTGYLVTSSKLGRQTLLYGRNGTFDPEIVDIDFQTQDTVSIGEFATSFSKVAANYTGPVTVITGEEDAAFCYVNATLRGNCGQGEDSPPAQTREFFPNASSFTYFIPKLVGHDINLHYRAHIAYEYAHNWLQSQGF